MEIETISIQVTFKHFITCLKWVDVSTKIPKTGNHYFDIPGLSRPLSFEGSMILLVPI